MNGFNLLAYSLVNQLVLNMFYLCVTKMFSAIINCINLNVSSTSTTSTL